MLWTEWQPLVNGCFPVINSATEILQLLLPSGRRILLAEVNLNGGGCDHCNELPNLADTVLWRKLKVDTE